METLEKFVNVLHGARGNMEGHVNLADSEMGATLENLKGPAEFQTAGTIYADDIILRISWCILRNISEYLVFLANNSDMVEKMEEVMMKWSRQIEQVLVESEQIRREADNIGPVAELNYWKSRMAKFNT